MADTVTGLLISSRKTITQQEFMQPWGLLPPHNPVPPSPPELEGLQIAGCSVVVFPIPHHIACGSFKCLNGHIHTLMQPVLCLHHWGKWRKALFDHGSCYAHSYS